MNRREMLTTCSMAVGGLVIGTGSSAAPACDAVSKDKAVRYTGLVIDLVKDTAPLFQLLNAPEVSKLVTDKAVPALEKLKDALEKSQLPAGGFLGAVKGVLGEISNALFHLPESVRRDTIIGIFATVNMFLLTVEMFVESEIPVANDDTGPRRAPAPYKPSATALAVRKAFEVTRFN